MLCRTLFCVYVLGGGQVGVEVTFQKAVGVGSGLPLGLPLSDQAPRRGQRDGERTKAQESLVGCSLHAAAVECDRANGSTHMYVLPWCHFGRLGMHGVANAVSLLWEM